MVQGDIDVARNFVALRNGFNEFIAPMCRVRIKQAHPEVALDMLDFAKKAGKSWAACRVHWLTGSGLRRPEIHSIIGRVLADQIDLANAFANESPNFGQHRFWRATAVFAAHLCNYAKTTRMIAAFGNLYVGGMRGRKPEARRIVIWNVSGPRFSKRKIEIVICRMRLT